MIEAFHAIESEGRSRNLVTNVEKTKVLVVSRRNRRHPNCEIEGRKFEIDQGI